MLRVLILSLAIAVLELLRAYPQTFSKPPADQSQILAIGFLLVILSSALWKNYLPLLVVATYVLAPVPNWLCGRHANPDDFMDSGASGIVELGRFMTGFMVVMGIGTSSLSSHPACRLEKRRDWSDWQIVLEHARGGMGRAKGNESY